MGDNRRFPGPGLPRDAAVDPDGQAAVGGFYADGNQFHNSEDEPDAEIGTDPNSAGHSKVFPPWWSREPEAG